MAKITEKHLKDLCSSMNRKDLATTPFGIGISRDAAGYAVLLTRRDNGQIKELDNSLAASEACAMIIGLGHGLEIIPGARVCPQCGKEMLEAKAKLTGVTYWLCRYCGKAVEA